MLRTTPYHTVATSKAVRDLCVARGESVARGNIMFILRGIALTGHRFSADPATDTAENFASNFFNNVISLCKEAELVLSDEEFEQLSDWICGGLTALTNEFSEMQIVTVPAVASQEIVKPGDTVEEETEALENETVSLHINRVIPN